MTEQEATSLLKQRDGGEEMGVEWEGDPFQIWRSPPV